MIVLNSVVLRYAGHYHYGTAPRLGYWLPLVTKMSIYSGITFYGLHLVCS